MGSNIARGSRGKTNWRKNMAQGSLNKEKGNRSKSYAINGVFTTLNVLLCTEFYVRYLDPGALTWLRTYVLELVNAPYFQGRFDPNYAAMKASQSEPYGSLDPEGFISRESAVVLFGLILALTIAYSYTLVMRRKQNVNQIDLGFFLAKFFLWVYLVNVDISVPKGWDWEFLMCLFLMSLLSLSFLALPMTKATAMSGNQKLTSD